MKRFVNKDFLHNIALHLDLFSTVSGGVSETYTDIKKNNQNAEIEVWAAGVKPEAFKVILHSNQLTVYSAMHSKYNPEVTAPIFSRTFVLPPAVNMAEIEAVYQDNKLHIKLPYHEWSERPKEIKIKQM